jgi:hypothetical protein
MTGFCALMLPFRGWGCEWAVPGRAFLSQEGVYVDGAQVGVEVGGIAEGGNLDDDVEVVVTGNLDIETV